MRLSLVFCENGRLYSGHTVCSLSVNFTLKKNSHDEILTALNSWDQDLKFTSEFLVENQLTFLSSKMFLQD